MQKLEGDRYCPSRDAVHYLCVLNNVRREGNLSAHTATQGEIKEAIKTARVEERTGLIELYEFLYQESI